MFPIQNGVCIGWGIDEEREMKDYQKVLGIDFGTKRIGIALSYGSLAEPVEIFANDSELFSRIQRLIKQHKVETVVVGISESKTAEKTIAFVAALEKHVAVPVVLADETLSTKDARAKLQQQGMNAYQADKAHVDHLAAAGILQEWLDEQ